MSHKNSDSQYKLLSSSDKSSSDKKGDAKLPVQDDEIVFKKKGNSKYDKKEKSKEGDVLIKFNSNRK